MSEQASTNTPITAADCNESAARVLRFAETETNGQLFEQYCTLAERWIELGINVRENATL